MRVIQVKEDVKIRREDKNQKARRGIYGMRSLRRGIYGMRSFFCIEKKNSIHPAAKNGKYIL